MSTVREFPTGHLNIGEAIRVVRERADLTQTEFGERVGVTQPAVSQWETGYSLLDRDQEERIEAIMGLDDGELRRIARQFPRLPKRRRSRRGCYGDAAIPLNAAIA